MSGQRNEEDRTYTEELTEEIARQIHDDIRYNSKFSDPQLEARISHKQHSATRPAAPVHPALCCRMQTPTQFAKQENVEGAQMAGQGAGGSSLPTAASQATMGASSLPAAGRPMDPGPPSHPPPPLAAEAEVVYPKSSSTIPAPPPGESKGEVVVTDDDRRALLTSLTKHVASNSLKAWWMQAIDRHLFVPPIFRRTGDRRELVNKTWIYLRQIVHSDKIPSAWRTPELESTTTHIYCWLQTKVTQQLKDWVSCPNMPRCVGDNRHQRSFGRIRASSPGSPCIGVGCTGRGSVRDSLRTLALCRRQ